MHEELFDLVDTLLRHGTTVEGNVGQGVGTSGADTVDLVRYPNRTISRDQSGHVEGLEHHVMPHPCLTCRNICYGNSSEFRGDGLLQYVSQTHFSHSLLFFIS